MADGYPGTDRSDNRISRTSAEHCADKPEPKRDAINLSILILLAMVIGIYLIATTVLISKDGVSYIEQSRKILVDSPEVDRAHAPGYPFLIVAAHRFTGFFLRDSSSFTWIYSAQGITLLFRLFGLIPLYFVGKQLVGSKKAFWGMLIVVLLPHPAKTACELTREWPYMFFLATGFLFLLWGARRSLWWTFGLAGLTAGMGYWIRPACIQLVAYGFLWLALVMVWPKVGRMGRGKAVLSAASLVGCFAVLALPYMKYTGYIVSPNAKHIFKVISLEDTLNQKVPCSSAIAEPDPSMAGMIPAETFKALGEILRTFGENLMWFFLPPVFAGLYYHLRYKAEHEEKFLMITFILINVTMMVVRYVYLQPHISYRWSMPLAVFTSFYICDGLQVIEHRLSRLSRTKGAQTKRTRLTWALLVVGMIICLPKLMQPVGDDKRGYRTAAKWLNENTESQDVLAVQDMRISFYAKRKGVRYEGVLAEEADYAVKIAKSGDEKSGIEQSARLQASIWVDKREKKKKILIWRISESTTATNSRKD